MRKALWFRYALPASLVVLLLAGCGDSGSRSSSETTGSTTVVPELIVGEETPSPPAPDEAEEGASSAG